MALDNLLKKVERVQGEMRSLEVANEQISQMLQRERNHLLNRLSIFKSYETTLTGWKAGTLSLRVCVVYAT